MQAEAEDLNRAIKGPNAGKSSTKPISCERHRLAGRYRGLDDVSPVAGSGGLHCWHLNLGLHINCEFSPPLFYVNGAPPKFYVCEVFFQRLSAMRYNLCDEVQPRHL